MELYIWKVNSITSEYTYVATTSKLLSEVEAAYNQSEHGSRDRRYGDINNVEFVGCCTVPTPSQPESKWPEATPASEPPRGRVVLAKVKNGNFRVVGCAGDGEWMVMTTGCKAIGGDEPQMWWPLPLEQGSSGMSDIGVCAAGWSQPKETR